MAGKQTSIHWDTGRVELEQGISSEIAARIQPVVTADDIKQWQQGSPAEWALESLAIVRTRVYPLPASREIAASYVEWARPVIRTRLLQAGARLALLLNQTFQ